MSEPLRAFLRHLAEGRPILGAVHILAGADAAALRSGARDALSALEGSPRIESREERIARLRLKHARAYEAWTDEEDARLLRRWDEGARLADIARELQRPPGAVRTRLERWLGPNYRDRSVEPTWGRPELEEP